MRYKYVIGRGLLYVALLVGALAVALPFIYAIATSFKTNAEALSNPLSLIPQHFMWENWVIPFSKAPLARQFLNSVIVGVAVTVLNVATCTMAGYSFAKFRYLGRDSLFLGTLATLMMPILVILVPLYGLAVSFGWLNTYWGLIIP